MAQAAGHADDHMPAVQLYIERCIAKNEHWSLDAATAVVNCFVQVPNRSKVKNLATTWLQNFLQRTDPLSRESYEAQRLLVEMRSEKAAKRKPRQPYKHPEKTHIHRDTRKFHGVNFLGPVQEGFHGTGALNFDAARSYTWEPTRWPGPETDGQVVWPTERPPRPSPAQARKERYMPLETMMKNGINFQFANGAVTVEPTKDNYEKLFNLGIDFIYEGGRVVLVRKVDDFEGGKASPAAKRPKFTSDHDDGNMPASKAPEGKDVNAAAGPPDDSPFPGPGLSPSGFESAAAQPAVKTNTNSAASASPVPLPGSGPYGVFPSHQEHPADERPKVIDVMKTKQPAGDHERSTTKEHDLDERFRTGAALNQTPKDLGTGAPAGRAPPPKGVEPHGAVLTEEGVTAGSKSQGATQEEARGAGHRGAGTGDYFSGDGFVEVAATGGGEQQEETLQRGTPQGPDDVLKISDAPLQGVEARGASLAPQDETCKKTPAELRTKVVQGNNVTSGAEADVSKPITGQGDARVEQESCGAAVPDNPDVAGYTNDDGAPLVPAPDRHDAAPEPEQEGEQDAGAAAAREQLTLAKELLGMETLDLLDALNELSRGLLKPQAGMLAVLEADRQAGILPEDGGSTLQKLIGIYKDRTGNPVGKSICKNIREWESAQNAVLEAKIALLQIEEERAEVEGEKQGGGALKWNEVGGGGPKAVEERVQKVPGEKDVPAIGEKVDCSGLIDLGEEAGEGNSDKENEVGLDGDGNGDTHGTQSRGVLTENGQDEGTNAGQIGKEKGSRGGGKSDARQPRADSTGNDGGNVSSDKSDQVAAPGEVTQEGAGQAADGARKASLIPLPPHLRAQPSESFDYVTLRGRGAVVGDAGSQRLTRSRSVSPGRPPRYGERRRSQGVSGIPSPANPGYVSSAGLLHVISTTATSSETSPAEARAPSSAVSAPNSKEELPLKDWVERRAGCAFVVGAGGLAPALGSGTKAAATGRPAEVGTARASATVKGSKAPPEEKATDLADAGPGIAAAGSQRELVRTMAQREMTGAQQEAAAKEHAAGAKNQLAVAVAAGADPSPGVWAELLASFLGGEDTDPKLRLDMASKPIDVSNVDGADDDGVAAAVGLLRLASAAPDKEDIETLLEPGDEAGSWLSDGKEGADAEGAAENGELFGIQIAGVAERWLQEY